MTSNARSVDKGLKDFLLEANKAGYAGGAEKTWVRESDRSTTILFEDGPWKLHDNFFGGEPYGGRTVVSHSGRPLWMMVYYGWVTESADPEHLYGVLRNALMAMPEHAPYRGPETYHEGKFTYRNHWQGQIDRFVGEEEIIEGELRLYGANYVGGSIDQRMGT